MSHKKSCVNYFLPGTNRQMEKKLFLSKIISLLQKSHVQVFLKTIFSKHYSLFYKVGTNLIFLNYLLSNLENDE